MTTMYQQLKTKILDWGRMNLTISKQLQRQLKKRKHFYLPSKKHPPSSNKTRLRRIDFYLLTKKHPPSNSWPKSNSKKTRLRRSDSFLPTKKHSTSNSWPKSNFGKPRPRWSDSRKNRSVRHPQRYSKPNRKLKDLSKRFPSLAAEAQKLLEQMQRLQAR